MNDQPLPSRRTFRWFRRQFKETPAPTEFPMPWESVPAPEGVHLSVPWLKEEFPELAGSRLPEPLELFRTVQSYNNPVRRWTNATDEETGKRRRRLLLAVNLVFAIGTLTALFFYHGGNIGPAIGAFFRLVWIGMILSFLVVFGRQLIRSLSGSDVPPVTPFEIMTSRNREHLEAILLTPITTRELFIGHLVRQVMNRDTMGATEPARPAIRRFFWWAMPWLAGLISGAVLGIVLLSLNRGLAPQTESVLVIVTRVGSIVFVIVGYIEYAMSLLRGVVLTAMLDQETRWLRLAHRKHLGATFWSLFLESWARFFAGFPTVARVLFYLLAGVIVTVPLIILTPGPEQLWAVACGLAFQGLAASPLRKTFQRTFRAKLRLNYMDFAAAFDAYTAKRLHALETGEKLPMFTSQGKTALRG